MKVAWAGESLADQLGTDDLPVLLDQASVRFMREEKLRHARHRERINQTENNSRDQRDEHGKDKEDIEVLAPVEFLDDDVGEGKDGFHT